MYGFTLSPAPARDFAIIWLPFFLLMIITPFPSMWLAEHLQDPYSFGRRLGRRFPWPRWLAA